MLKLQFSIALILDVCLFVRSFENKYCGLSCNYFIEPTSHTVCDRKLERCGPGPQCGSHFKEIRLNDDDRRYIVDIHNYLRNKVALGYEKRGHQPSAANMNMMRYNKELEFIAQCWSNTCNGKPLKHDRCRRTEYYEHVGQNLGFVNTSLPHINLVYTIKDILLLWYNEVELFNSSWVNDTQDRDVKVGHYTQMLWSDSTEIGCAATYYVSESGVQTTWYHMILVCNYGPGGNYLGAPLYQTGKPASKCPSGFKRDRVHKGLCGLARINIDESRRAEI